MSTERSWSDLFTTLLRGNDLRAADTSWVMRQVIDGAAADVHIAGFLIALRAKGETAEEIRGLADALLDHAVPIVVPGSIVDIVGTGGDRSGAANLSTMAAIVVASTGVTVVKHGGRAASSTTAGSADTLERLGISLDLSADAVARIAAKAGITFVFAPRFNSGLRHAASVRRQLGIPTVLNVLAPLINPARPRHQLVGVSDPRMCPIIAGVLAERGSSALVVRGDDGLDKLTTATTSQVWMVRDGLVSSHRLDPRDLGIPYPAPGSLGGADGARNARVVREVLTGQSGSVRDAVVLNAAAALVTVEPGVGALTDQVAAMMDRCAKAIDSGAAADTLDRWIAAIQDA